MIKKYILESLIIGILLINLAHPVLASSVNASPTEKIHPNLLKNIESMPPEELVEVVIRLKPLPDETKISVTGRYELAVSSLKSWAYITQEPIVRLINAKGGYVLNRFWLDNVVLARVPASMVKLLATHPDVVKIFENFKVEVIKPVEKMKVIESQVSSWGIFKIRANEAWALGYTGQGIRIAVLDTGVDISHPALSGKMLTLDPSSPYYPGGWMEFDSAGNPVLSVPHDTDGHGTHTSGTALGGNTENILIGVAPGATLMHGLVLPGGGGTFAQVLAGMQWTVEPFYLVGGTPVPTGLPAHVVSMSFGANEYYGNELLPAIKNMLLANIIPIASIGNSGPGTSGNPGNIWGVFGIGATDINDNVASWSSGKIVTWPSPPESWPFFDTYPSTYIKPDFSAPGVSIVSSVPGGGYEAWSGTSMACPHVSGLVALILQAAGWMYFDVPDVPEKVYIILNSTAVDFGDPGLDTRYGWGRIDALEAVSKAREYAKKTGVEGFVTDSVSGEPIPWALVRVLETNQTFYVNGSGFYRIPLDPGTYTLQFEAWGYESFNTTVEVVLLNGTITGLVLDALSGYPIANATVTVMELNLTVLTDEDGLYTVKVPPGTYDLLAEAVGYQPLQLSVTVDEAEIVIVNFPLYPLGNGTLWGYVYDATTSQPIADAIVYTFVNNTLVYNTTDSSGYYELSLPSGQYVVRAYKPGYVEKEVTVVIAPLVAVRQDFNLESIPPSVIVLANVDFDTSPHLRLIVENLGLPVLEYNDMDVLVQDWVNGVINPAVIVIDHTKPSPYSYPTNTTLLAFHLLADYAGTSLIWLCTSYSGYPGIYVLMIHNSTLVANGYPAPVSRLFAYPTPSNVVVEMLNTTHPIFNGVEPDIPPDKFYLATLTSSYADYVVYNFTDPTGRLNLLGYVRDLRTEYPHYFGVGVAEWVSNSNVSWFYLGSWAESYWMQYLEPGADGMYSSNTKKVLENAIMLGWSQATSTSIRVRGDFEKLARALMLATNREVKPGLVAECGVVKNIYTRVDVTLNRLPHGFVEGFVLGSDGIPLSNAIIQVLGTPVKVKTDVNGFFSTWLPEGAYTLLIQAAGYRSAYIEVEVLVNATVNLGEIVLKRLPRIGIMWDYAGSFKNFFEANGWYAASYTNLTQLTEDVLAGLIDVVIYSGDYGVPFPTSSEFQAFLNATMSRKVGVVWMDSYGSYGYGIKVLNRELGDPASVGFSWGAGQVYVVVEASHPIFRGYPPGSTVMINSYSSADFSWFSDFSGVVIGSILVGGSVRGAGVAYKEFDNGVKWVLLSSFAITSWNTPDTFTPNFWNIVYNSVRWIIMKPLNVAIDNKLLHVGDSYTLIITGALPNDTLLIMIDGNIIGLTTADENGSAIYSGEIPLIPGGMHLFEVVNIDETHYGSVDFTVLPKLEIQPEAIVVPGRVHLTVTGLSSHQTFYVYLDSNFLTVSTANMSGARSLVLNIPLVDEGVHEISITDLLGEPLVIGSVNTLSKLEMIFANTQQAISLLETLNAEIIGVRDNTVLINTSLGLVNAKLETILNMLSSLDAKIVGLNDSVVLIDTKIGLLNVSLASLIQVADEIKMEVIGVRDNTALINTSLGLVNAKVDTLIENLGLLDAKISLLNQTVLLIKTKVGEIDVSVNEFQAMLSSMNASLVSLIRDEGGRIYGLVNTTRGNILIEIDALKQILNNKLPISTEDLSAGISDIKNTLNNVANNVEQLQGSVGMTTNYGLASVGLSILILGILGYVGFVRRK
ncbi:MAG: carboxypeptidase regulatory-like domain-containing protein [Thermosphaera sp.]